MILYHGTKKENVESILLNGFSIDKQGENGSHFGNGVYLATTKKRARLYGKHVITVEADISNLAYLTAWLKPYKKKCKEIYESGVSESEVNTVVGNFYRELYLSQGFDGIIMDSITGNSKEIVIYDMSVINSIRA